MHCPICGVPMKETRKGSKVWRCPNNGNDHYDEDKNFRSWWDLSKEEQLHFAHDVRDNKVAGWDELKEAAYKLEDELRKTLRRMGLEGEIEDAITGNTTSTNDREEEEEGKEYYVDFQSWHITGKDADDVRQKAIERLEAGEKVFIDSIGLLDDE